MAARIESGASEEEAAAAAAAENRSVIHQSEGGAQCVAGNQRVASAHGISSGENIESIRRKKVKSK